MKRIFCCLTAIVCFYWVGLPGLYAQTQSRTYANFQGVYRTGLYLTYGELVFGSVTNPGMAADQLPSTSSSLVIGAGLAGLASVTQYLAFTGDGSLGTVRQISAGVPVTIKLSVPSSLIGLADNVEVGVFTGLQSVSRSISGVVGTGAGNAAGHHASGMTALYSGSTLLNLLNGAGETDLSFTPSQAYEGVYLKLSGELLSVNLSSALFHAYIMENNPVPCALQAGSIDVLSGVRGNALVGILSATGTVTDPWSAVDEGSGALSTYASLSTGAQVLSEVFETVVFSVPSQPGDSLQLVIEDPGGGLLDLNLLGGLKITTYLGTVEGTTIESSESGLSLRLVSSSSSKYLLSVPVAGSFDRVDIKLGGVAGVLSQLRIYDVEKLMPRPQVTGDAGTTSADTVYVYAGTPLNLTANSTDPVSWYNSSDVWLSDGSVYAIPAVWTDGIYTARSTRNSCQETSSSYTVYVKVMTHVTLPVRDLQLSGRSVGEAVEVNWTAREETGVSHYVVQKEGDGGAFTDLAVVFSGEGVLNPAYRFLDKRPLPGNNIYRLAVHDVSGEVHYSGMIGVDWAARTQLRLDLSPNPVSRNSTVYVRGLNAGDYKLSMYTSIGQPVWHKTIKVTVTGAGVPVIFPDAVPGLYWLTAISSADSTPRTLSVLIR